MKSYTEKTRTLVKSFEKTIKDTEKHASIMLL